MMPRPAIGSPSRVPQAYAPFASRDFRLFFLARLSNAFGTNIMMPALGWQIYVLTHSPLALGTLGLCVFVPVMLASIPAGQIADRFERQRAYQAAQVLLVVTAAILLGLTLGGVRAVWPFYLGGALFGAAKTISMPVATAWMPHLVPRDHFQRAVSWTSSTYQMANTAGPVLAGWVLVAAGQASVHALAAGCYALSLGLARAIHVSSRGGAARATSVAGLFDGFTYIRRDPLILGAVTLDVVALFLGGATALLPAYAWDVLHVGARGFGLLRAAPALGALVMGFWFAHHPLRRRAGWWLFGAVAGYGVAIVAFGVSRDLWLSLAALALVGAMEMTGGFIRQTLIQLATRDDMRGRVTAVNMMCFSARSELGEMESGFLASLIGVVPAVVAGGLATIAVAVIWALLFPGLMAVNRLGDRRPQD